MWVALVAFGVILMFAGWFLDPQTPATGPLYVTFVLSWTTYLIVLLALFISAFSLPNDIKNRTIHTVVTKPVRSGEIVLGAFWASRSSAPPFWPLWPFAAMCSSCGHSITRMKFAWRISTCRRWPPGKREKLGSQKLAKTTFTM